MSTVPRACPFDAKFDGIELPVCYLQPASGHCTLKTSGVQWSYFRANFNSHPGAVTLYLTARMLITSCAIHELKIITFMHRPGSIETEFRYASHRHHLIKRVMSVNDLRNLTLGPRRFSQPPFPPIFKVEERPAAIQKKYTIACRDQH